MENIWEGARLIKVGSLLYLWGAMEMWSYRDFDCPKVEWGGRKFAFMYKEKKKINRKYTYVLLLMAASQYSVSEKWDS